MGSAATASQPRRTAARRAFSPAFSITQRDVVPSAELDADRNPCAVWLD
jgi:acyl dehydratase